MTTEELQRVLARVRGETAAVSPEITETAADCLSEEARPVTETAADRLSEEARLATETEYLARELLHRCRGCAPWLSGISRNGHIRCRRAQTELLLLRGDTASVRIKVPASGVLSLLRSLCTALEREGEQCAAFLERETEAKLIPLWQGFIAVCERDSALTRTVLEKALEREAGK